MTGRFGEFTIIKPLSPYLGRGSREVRSHHVIYKSGDLAITAWLYLPPENYDGAPKGGHPLDLPAPKGGAIVAGHGGIWGVPSHYDNVLRRLAASGWTVAAPSYRGENGSDGKIEFALGEVDDTIACWKALTSLDKIDPSRTWLLGSSHGAMVNLHLLARDDFPKEIPGAVSVSGVYDLTTWFIWMEETRHFLLEDPFFKRLLESGAEALEQRSVIYKADKIGKPIFLLHGQKDSMVPEEQTWNLANELETAGNFAYKLRIDTGAEHEYIWAPDRPGTDTTWSEILNFIESGGHIDEVEQE
ncbi:MAG TPA: hypothetical protein ENN67_04350 [Firmicutes bacterium]|nr:hypothetical protein [Bacillota bacterium]